MSRYREQDNGDFWDITIRNLSTVKYGCCCCCGLRTGTLVIGWTYVILSTLSLISWLKEGIALNVEALRKTSIGGDRDDTTAHYHFGDRATLVLYSILMVIEALASVGLLVGVYKNDMKLVKIWIQVFLVSFVVGFIWEIFKYGVQTFLGEVTIIFFLLVLLSLMVIKSLQFWKIRVVGSYYKQEIDRREK